MPRHVSHATLDIETLKFFSCKASGPSAFGKTLEQVAEQKGGSGAFEGGSGARLKTILQPATT